MRTAAARPHPALPAQRAEASTPRTVRFAATGDLEAVLAISRAHVDPQDADAGFLVSDFSIDRYRSFLDLSGPRQGGRLVTFLVCTDSGRDVPVGFLVAYRSDHVTPAGFGALTTERRLLARFGDAPAFHVIKQVGVAKDRGGEGIGGLLYKAFLRLLTVEAPDGLPQDVFAAVTGEPPNRRSARFHEAMGFLPVLSHGRAPTSEQAQTDVWHVTAQGALLRGMVRPEGPSRREALRAALQSASSGLAHERKAAWARAAFSVQWVLAAVGAQFLLPLALPAIPALLGQALLGLLGFGLIAASDAAIRRSERRASAHRRAVLLAEGKLQSLSPAYQPSNVLESAPHLAPVTRWTLGGILAVASVVHVGLHVMA